MSPGGRPYLSVGYEDEGAAREDLQISFATQLMKILFTGKGPLSLCVSVQRPTPCLPVRKTCSHITLGPDLDAGRAIHGWRDRWCQLSVAHPSAFCSAVCKRKDGRTVIAQLPRNAHTAHARTHKRRRAPSDATRADMTFHFSIKDSAFFSPSPLASALGFVAALGKPRLCSQCTKHK